jgi:hypothetical protein
MQAMGRPKDALKVLSFVPWFRKCSHCVPNGFSSGSQYVPQIFNVFPNMFSIAPHFYPLCLGECCPPFTDIGGRKGRNSILQNRRFYFVKASIVALFLSDGPVKWVCCKKLKK